MLTGKRFKIQKETIALDVINGRRTVVVIPVGAIIKVVSGPVNSDRMVDVAWNGKTVMMFAEDVDVRGAEIAEPDRNDDLSARA